MSRPPEHSDEHILNEIIPFVEERDGKLTVDAVAKAANCMTARAGRLLKQFEESRRMAAAPNEAALNAALHTAFDRIRAVAKSFADQRVSILQQGHETALHSKDLTIQQLTERNKAQEQQLFERDKRDKDTHKQLGESHARIEFLERELATSNQREATTLRENKQLHEELGRAKDANIRLKERGESGLEAKLDQLHEDVKRLNEKGRRP